MLRIDDRLLHGQVIFMWTKYLNIKGIIVANDEVIHDPIQMTAMKLSVPNHFKLLFKGIDDAVRILNNPRSQNMNILVMVSDPKDASRILRGIDDTSYIEKINIGNSGRIDKGQKKMLTKEVYVDEEDIQIMEEILNYPIPFEIQMVPTSNKVEVKEVLENYKMS